jgi:hypothetical protein
VKPTTESALIISPVVVVVIVFAVIAAWQLSLPRQGPFSGMVVKTYPVCDKWWETFGLCPNQQGLTIRLDNGTVIEATNGEPPDQCIFFISGQRINVSHWVFGWYQDNNGVICV